MDRIDIDEKELKKYVYEYADNKCPSKSMEGIYRSVILEHFKACIQFLNERNEKLKQSAMKQRDAIDPV